MKLILSNMLENLEYELIKGDIQKEITTLVYDSRKVEKNSLFVCISGAVFDAHDFIGDVVEKGATVIVIEKDADVTSYEGVTFIKVRDTHEALAYLSAAYFGHPARELTTIGITGTKGKTTTTYMVRQSLESCGIKTGLIGTIEMIVGDEHIPVVNTTPESYIIQETFRKMVDAGLKCVVMEVSSQGLMLHRVAGFTFDYGVFTNLSKDHIGPNEHSSFEEYLDCKAMLFKNCKVGIVNGDDSHVEEILAGATCQVQRFSVDSPSEFKADNLELFTKPGVLGIGFDLSGEMNGEIKVDIPGKFNVYNSLCAIAICSHFTKDLGVIAKALENIRVNGRAEIIPVSDKFTVMVDYAHNAVSLESLLKALREYNPTRLVALFGCGGNRSRDRRFEMGEVSSNMADFTIITSDNPRKENPVAIIDDIIVGFKKGPGEFVRIEDRKEAIFYALDNAKEGDVIVIAGKGHEDYQEINGVKHHFSDREVVEEYAGRK